MSKANNKAMAFVQNTAYPSGFKESFEVQEAEKPKGFKEEFIAAPLSLEEDRKIQLILADDSIPNQVSDDQITGDHKTLVDITSQIRAIERQNVLLHGERIFKAKEVLKPYRNGAFTKWLEVAYGNRQTPYRMLQYFEFFQSLTSDVRQLMQSMPKKAAYILAAREGDPEKKIEIIKVHHSDRPDNIIKIVQEMFPLEEGDRRKLKANDTVLIDQIRTNLKRLLKRKENLTEVSMTQIGQLSTIISEIVGESQELSPSNLENV